MVNGLGIYNYHSFFHINSIIYQCKYCRNIDIDVKIKDVSRLAELWQRLWCKILGSIAEIFDGTAGDA